MRSAMFECASFNKFRGEEKSPFFDYLFVKMLGQRLCTFDFGGVGLTHQPLKHFGLPTEVTPLEPPRPPPDPDLPWEVSLAPA